MDYYKFGTISGTVYNPSDGKPINGRWEIRWYSYPMDEAGVSKVVYDLYKTQDGTQGNSVATACIMKAYATKGTLRNTSSSCVPIHGDTPDSQKETYSFNTTDGLTYKSGVYNYNSSSSRIGCKFTRTYQEYPENEIFPSTATQDLSYYGTPHAVGEILIEHDSNGEAEITFELYNWIYEGTGLYPNSGYRSPYTKATTSIEDYHSITAVTAPTSFGVSRSTASPISPSSTVKFTWYGANHGTNNNIKQYNVNFYANTSASSLGTLIGSTTASHADGVWSEASINLSKVTALTQSNLRGKWITCTIQTIGTNSGYDSDVVSCGKGILVNRKPTAPTISATSSTRIPQSGGTVNFSGSVGTDSDTSVTKNIFTNEAMSTSTRTLKYRIGTSGSYTDLTNSSFSITIASGTTDVTLNFYTYDGVEYSTATQVTISRNIKPVITLNTTPTYINQSTSYTISSALSVSENNGKSSMSYVFGIKYSTNSNFSSSKKVVLRELNTTSTYSVSDIRGSIDNFATTTGAYYYKFYAQGYDGFDYSDEKESSVYYIPAKPNFQGIYNKLNGSSVSGLSSYFSNNISLKFALDQGYDSVSVYSPITMEAKLVKNSSNMIVNIENIPQTLAGGQEYTFNVRFYKNNELRYQTALSTSKLSRVQTFKTSLANDYSTSTTPLKIYTANGKGLSLNLTLTKSDGTLPSLDNLSAFGISKIYESCYLNIGNNNRIKLSLSSTNFKYQDSAGTIVYTYTISSTLFNNIKGELNLKGLVSLPLSFDILDDFGSYVKISSLTGISIDCREAATCETSYGSGAYDTNYMSISNSNKTTYYTLANSDYLVQGMYLFYTGTIRSYNPNPKGQIWIKRGEDAWAKYGSSFNFSGSGTSSPGNPVKYTVTRLQINSIGKIARKDYNVSFKIVVSTDGGIDYEHELINGLTAKEHQEGVISITDASYSKSEGKLNLTYIVNNPGINLTSTSGMVISAKFKIEQGSTTTNLTVSNYIPSGNKLGYNNVPYTSAITKQLTLNADASVFYGTLEVSIEYTYTIGGLSFANTYITSSPKITIYNESPTVSYRKNRLGINTNQIDAWNDAVLVVSANNSVRKKILIVTPEVNPNSTTNYILSIDTYTGTIDGAIIDGGTW